jgi:hypothetical protein
MKPGSNRMTGILGVPVILYPSSGKWLLTQKKKFNTLPDTTTIIRA